MSANALQWLMGCDEGGAVRLACALEVARCVPPAPRLFPNGGDADGTSFPQTRRTAGPQDRRRAASGTPSPSLHRAVSFLHVALQQESAEIGKGRYVVRLTDVGNGEFDARLDVWIFV